MLVIELINFPAIRNYEILIIIHTVKVDFNPGTKLFYLLTYIHKWYLLLTRNPSVCLTYLARLPQVVINLPIRHE